MWLFAVAAFAGASGIHYQTPMLGAMAAEFGADAQAIGWVPTLTFGGFLAGIVLLLPLGDRVDKRQLILVQQLGATLALLAAGAATGPAGAAASGFFVGLFSSFAQSVIPLVAERTPPEQRGRALGTVLSALFLGILFARLAGGAVAEHLGWRWMYLIAASMHFALTPALLARLPHSAPQTSLGYRELLASLPALLREHAELRRVVAIQGLLGVCYGGFWATLATMLFATHGLGAAVAGLIGIPGAAGILIARPAGRSLDQRGPGPIVAAGAALVLAANAVIALGVIWPLALAAGAALLDCGLRAAMVANQTVVNSLVPGARSRSNTIFGIAVWGGNAVGALVASTALAASGWLAVCAISALVAGGALAFQLRAGR